MRAAAWKSSKSVGLKIDVSEAGFPLSAGAPRPWFQKKNGGRRYFDGSRVKKMAVPRRFSNRLIYKILKSPLARDREFSIITWLAAVFSAWTALAEQTNRICL